MSRRLVTNRQEFKCSQRKLHSTPLPVVHSLWCAVVVHCVRANVCLCVAANSDDFPPQTDTTHWTLWARVAVRGYAALMFAERRQWRTGSADEIGVEMAQGTCVRRAFGQVAAGRAVPTMGRASTRHSHTNGRLRGPSRGEGRGIESYSYILFREPLHLALGGAGEAAGAPVT